MSLIYFTGAFFIKNRFSAGAGDKSKTRTAAEILMLSLFVFTNPLVAHFNLSMLADSFALSFTLVFLGGVSFAGDPKLFCHRRRFFFPAFPPGIASSLNAAS